MNIKNTLIISIGTSILVLFLVDSAYANESDKLKPQSCTRMNIMNINVKIELSSRKHKCIKYVVHNGGSLHYDIFSEDTSVILVKPGGKLTSEENVHAIINRGGEVNIIDGTVKFLHAEAGITKVTTKAEIENQSGGAFVELDNNMKVKK